jgi:hypothetical protein
VVNTQLQLLPRARGGVIPSRGAGERRCLASAPRHNPLSGRVGVLRRRLPPQQCVQYRITDRLGLAHAPSCMPHNLEDGSMVNRFVLLAATAVIGNAAWARAPANAPGGSTALCNDGTYWSGATKRGACSGHHGLQSWYGTAASANAPATVPKTADSASESGATPARPAPVTNAATPKAPATVPKVRPPAGQGTESAPGSAGADAPSPGSPAAPATVPKVSAPSGTSARSAASRV